MRKLVAAISSETIKWALKMLSPVTAGWVEHHSRVAEELAGSGYARSGSSPGR